MSGQPGRVFLGLGSNLGDRAAWIEQAISALGREPAFVCLQRATLYRTEAMGPDAGGPFLNTVVAGLWSDTPETLLAACQRIETRCGRERTHHWAPRTLDIDILFWEGVRRDHDTLRIPHPGLCERVFTLVPLLEIAPDLAGDDGRRLNRSLTQDLMGQGIEACTTGVSCA